MAAAITPALTPAALAHPAFDPLRPWLAGISSLPECSVLNTLAAGGSSPPSNAAGIPVQFRNSPPGAAEPYEQRVFETGVVQTRAGNLHDLFNALAWMAFPQTKAALNARHVERLAAEGTRRGPLRDLLTLFDEGGVIVACERSACAGIEASVREFRWQALFWECRAFLLSNVRFVLTGHNAYEKALAPYPGITCKALFVPIPEDLLAAPMADLVAWLDLRAAEWVRALPVDARPRQMAPLPVFGYPGWLPDSGNAGFYGDMRWFRVGRHLPDPAPKA